MSGDKIVCPYHGMEFNSRGVCTKAPTQHMKPKTAEIPSYAVREVGAYIWIWMGDQDAIDTDPPEVGYQVDPDWSPVNGYYEVAANWVLIRENVLDLTHIAFLHKNTFKQDDWIVAELGTGSVVRADGDDPSQRIPLASDLAVPLGLAATEDALWVGDMATGIVWQLAAAGEPPAALGAGGRHHAQPQ